MEINNLFPEIKFFLQLISRRQKQQSRHIKIIMSQETTLLSTSSAKVSHALKLLSQLQEKREEELVGIPTDAVHDESDVENACQLPPSL